MGKCLLHMRIKKKLIKEYIFGLSWNGGRYYSLDNEVNYRFNKRDYDSLRRYYICG